MFIRLHWSNMLLDSEYVCLYGCIGYLRLQKLFMVYQVSWNCEKINKILRKKFKLMVILHYYQAVAVRQSPQNQWRSMTATTNRHKSMPAQNRHSSVYVKKKNSRKRDYVFSGGGRSPLVEFLSFQVINEITAGAGCRQLVENLIATKIIVVSPCNEFFSEGFIDPHQ